MVPTEVVLFPLPKAMVVVTHSHLGSTAGSIVSVRRADISAATCLSTEGCTRDGMGGGLPNFSGDDNFLFFDLTAANSWETFGILEVCGFSCVSNCTASLEYVVLNLRFLRLLLACGWDLDFVEGLLELIAVGVYGMKNVSESHRSS